jgi:hypothetical protein
VTLYRFELIPFIDKGAPNVSIDRKIAMNVTDVSFAAINAPAKTRNYPLSDRKSAPAAKP